MHTPIEIRVYGHELTITVATTNESHSHFSKNPEQFLKTVQEVRNVLRNIDSVVVK